MKKNHLYLLIRIIMCATGILLIPACDSELLTTLVNTSQKTDSTTTDENQTTTAPADHPVPPILATLDTDANGELSADEIDNAPTALLTLDDDGDGTITQDELCPSRPENTNEEGDQPAPPPGSGPRHGPRGPGGPPADPILTALDTDKDGSLSAAEIQNAPAALKTLDTSGDGILTQDELRPQPQERPAPPLLKALDTDADGELAATEIDNAPTALLTLDANGDGTITQDELCPTRPENGTEEGDQPAPPCGGPGPRHDKRGPGGPPADPILTALDTDSDGALSAAEIQNAPTALKTLDTNSDGTISHDELLPPPPDKNNE